MAAQDTGMKVLKISRVFPPGSLNPEYRAHLEDGLVYFLPEAPQEVLYAVSEFLNEIPDAALHDP